MGRLYDITKLSTGVPWWGRWVHRNSIIDEIFIVAYKGNSDSTISKHHTLTNHITTVPSRNKKRASFLCLSGVAIYPRQADLLAWSSQKNLLTSKPHR